MGLARDLSMGPRRRSGGRASGSVGVFPQLRAITAAAAAGQPVDVERFRLLIAAAGATSSRLRFAEGAVYNEACAAYSTLTGAVVGPSVGQLPEPSAATPTEGA